MTSVARGKDGKRRVAMILSGGGARGAYEVGVLWYIFDDLTRILGGPPRIDILCGTSVGAINACYLAAHLARSGPRPAPARRPVERRRAHARARLRLPAGARRFRACSSAAATGTASSTCGPWRSSSSARSAGAPSRAACGAGMLRALTVSCTEVSTGRTVVFMQTSPDLARAHGRAAAHALPRRPHRPAPRARQRGDPAALSAGPHRRRALPRRRPAPEHAHRARAAARRDAHLRHRQLARGERARRARGRAHRDDARPGRGVLARQGAQRVPARPRRRRHRAPDADQQRPRRRHARVRRRLRRGAHAARRASAAPSSTAT